MLSTWLSCFLSIVLALQVLVIASWEKLDQVQWLVSFQLLQLLATISSNGVDTLLEFYCVKWINLANPWLNSKTSTKILVACEGLACLHSMFCYPVEFLMMFQWRCWCSVKVFLSLHAHSSSSHRCKNPEWSESPKDVFLVMFLGNLFQSVFHVFTQ